MSSLGLDTRTLWYLSRGTGMVTLMLLTLTLVLGIAAMREGRWLGAPRFVVSGLHRNVSLLVVAFVSVHIATSVIDPFVGIRLIDAVVPFVSSYRTGVGRTRRAGARPAGRGGRDQPAAGAAGPRAPGGRCTGRST